MWSMSLGRVIMNNSVHILWAYIRRLLNKIELLSKEPATKVLCVRSSSRKVVETSFSNLIIHRCWRKSSFQPKISPWSACIRRHNRHKNGTVVNDCVTVNKLLAKCRSFLLKSINRHHSVCSIRKDICLEDHQCIRISVSSVCALNELFLSGTVFLLLLY